MPAGRSQRAANERRADADEEPRQIIEPGEGHRDARSAGSRKRQRQRRERAAPADDDGSDRPRKEAEEAPDGEEEEDEGEAGLCGHVARVKGLGVRGQENLRPGWRELPPPGGAAGERFRLDDRQADDFVSCAVCVWRGADVLAELLGDDLAAFFDERGEELAFVDGADDLALAEDDAAALAAGDAEVGVARSPGPLTTQPMTATVIGLPSVMKCSSTLFASGIRSISMRPQVGQATSVAPRWRRFRELRMS